MTDPHFRIGARGSALSRAQTEGVRRALASALALPIEALPLTVVSTSGDRQQEGLLIDVGGKGLFTKELDDALFDGRIDLAVHSLKDVPARLPDGLALACIPARADPRDAFVSASAQRLEDLPRGAIVGTASLRRQAQTLSRRPDLKVAVLRGNVDTRLARIAEGHMDATFLALAGLQRLGLEAHARSCVDPKDCPPAPCQGALAITARSSDVRALAACAALEDASARIEIEAERAFLASLDGSCRTPIGALARRRGDVLTFVGEVLTPDGAQSWRRSAAIPLGSNPIEAAQALGERLGGEIRAEASDALPSQS